MYTCVYTIFVVSFSISVCVCVCRVSVCMMVPLIGERCDHDGFVVCMLPLALALQCPGHS